ncbi:hypothetical protein N7466_003038 [Penicillium verhagenii]|uniref:uncharacterized protein n=1 Tax=Penicillium verhagenii TaxID=1562060 RepID=UPI002544F4A3|nr:uncharacterized protein N7466_003038 [Penicillium verhagenii]KAJ5936588.1 hypothetical protein N7466_003038 [Penicillium verhagenii]
MAPRSFTTLVIAVSGTIPGFKQAEIKTLVEGNSATFANSVDNTCTHLIATEKEVAKKSAKYQAACKVEGCQVVSVDWLVESSERGKVLPELVYLLDQEEKIPPTENAGDKGKKRAMKQEDDAEAPESNKKQKESQCTSSRTLNVPIDYAFLPSCPFLRNRQGSKVHIEDSLIWDATLNQAHAGNNNNKFYRIQLIASEDSKEFVTWCRWGRIGEQGQFATLGHGGLQGAKACFEKKFKDKSGLKWENRFDDPKKGKYTFIERSYEDDEEPNKTVDKTDADIKVKVESTLTKPVQNLMSFIFNQQHFDSAMASMSYDAAKLPLGKLSDRTLRTGFTTLKQLARLATNPVHDTAWQTSVDDLSNVYFTTIPHVFGRNRPPILNSIALIKREVELLDALSEMDVGNEIMKDAKKLSDMNELDSQFSSLGLKEMTPLEPGQEFTELAAYLNNSRGQTHNLKYEVIDIFRVERDGENDRFTSSEFSKLQNSDRRLLWHGSRSTNFGGILSQGLRIAPPEAPVSGYMFGKGIYLADISSKSANYCCHHSSGNMALLLLCDAELGSPMLELYQSDYMAGEIAKKEGKIATLGQGRAKPGGWKKASCLNENLANVLMPDTVAPQIQDQTAGLQYNEYICYDVAQIRLRYLFYVKMG